MNGSEMLGDSAAAAVGTGLSVSGGRIVGPACPILWRGTQGKDLRCVDQDARGTSEPTAEAG